MTDYYGPLSCSAMDIVSGGDKLCFYGCLGGGDCVEACPFNALFMNENGIPELIEAKCTGCSMCVKACPRNIISLLPESAYFIISCVSPDFGPAVSKVCKKGCIGCGICVKTNEEKGIVMQGKLPVVDHAEFSGDNTGAEKCPPKVIEFREMPFNVKKRKS